MGTPDRASRLGPKIQQQIRGSDEMVSLEERLSKTGTPSLASASPPGHYNPDLVFLSSEPIIGVFCNTGRAMLTHRYFSSKFYDTDLSSAATFGLDEQKNPYLEHCSRW